MRTAENKKRSKAKSPQQVQKNEALIIEAHQAYLSVAQDYLQKARQTLALIERQGLADVLDLVKKAEIEGFMAHAARQIEQVQRRRTSWQRNKRERSGFLSVRFQESGLVFVQEMQDFMFASRTMKIKHEQTGCVEIKRWALKI